MGFVAADTMLRPSVCWSIMNDGSRALARGARRAQPSHLPQHLRPSVVVPPTRLRVYAMADGTC